MNKKQEEMMKLIKEMQKRKIRQQKLRLNIGYLMAIILVTAITWLMWEFLIINISPFPSLPFLAVGVLVLIVFASIFSISALARFILGSLKKGRDND